MAKSIKGITIEIGGDVQPLNKALEGVNKQSKNLQSELRQVERLLKLDPKNTELVAQKQKLLGEAVSSTKEKLDTLKEAERQAQEQFKRGEISEEQYRALQREVVKTEQDLKKLEKQLKDTGLTAEQLGNKMVAVGNKMTGVGKKMSTYVTAPLVGLGTMAAKTAIDFESAFAGVRKTVDATEEEFGALEKGIRDMAREIPAAATEIAGVAAAAGQLGIETEAILGFTRTMIDLGEATNMSADEAATALARLANITQMPQSEFDKLGSTVVELGNNLATTESEIVEMGLRLAGAGKQVGLTEAQILSFAGALSSVGVEAQAGGSAFSKVMVQMQLATETGGQALEDFASVAGMSAGEFKQAFQEDAAGAIIAFIQGLGTAEERGISAIKVLDDMGIKEVRLRDALLRAAGAGDLFNQSIETGAKAWEENTALTEEAEERYKTTASQLEILKNNVIEVAMQFGEILLPPLLKTVDAVKAFLEKLDKMDPATKRVIVIIAAVAAVLGPVLVALGTLISSVGHILLLLPKIKLALLALKTVMLFFTGPVGIIALVTAAVIALVAAFVSLRSRTRDVMELFQAETEARFQEIRRNVLKETAEKISGIIEEYERLVDEGSWYFQQLYLKQKAITEEGWGKIKSEIERQKGEYLQLLQSQEEEALVLIREMRARGLIDTDEHAEEMAQKTIEEYTRRGELVEEGYAEILEIARQQYEEYGVITREGWEKIRQIQIEMRQQEIEGMQAALTDMTAIRAQVFDDLENIEYEEYRKRLKRLKEHENERLEESDAALQEELKLLEEAYFVHGVIDKDEYEKMVRRASKAYKERNVEIRGQHLEMERDLRSSFIKMRNEAEEWDPKIVAAIESPWKSAREKALRQVRFMKEDIHSEIETMNDGVVGRFRSLETRVEAKMEDIRRRTTTAWGDIHNKLVKHSIVPEMVQDIIEEFKKLEENIDMYTLEIRKKTEGMVSPDTSGIWRGAREIERAYRSLRLPAVTQAVEASAVGERGRADTPAAAGGNLGPLYFIFDLDGKEFAKASVPYFDLEMAKRRKVRVRMEGAMG